jgi:hypothetical protein
MRQRNERKRRKGVKKRFPVLCHLMWEAREKLCSTNKIYILETGNVNFEPVRY